jgi:hypothetical protein
VDAPTLPPAPWETLLALAPAARRFVLRNLQFRQRPEPQLAAALSALRAHASYLGAQGGSTDQTDFLAIVDAVTEAHAHGVMSEEDAGLAATTLKALFARALPLDHPVVQHFVRHPMPLFRYHIARAVPTETAEGRAVLALLRNDPVAWVREEVHRRLPPEGQPPSWQGVFSRDPDGLADEAERAAAQRIVTRFTAPAAQKSPDAAAAMQPDLDALSQPTLLDLATTALRGVGVTRGEAKALFQQCLDRDLAPAVLAACWPGWGEYYLWRHPLETMLEGIDAWAEPRRTDTLFALVDAYAAIHAVLGDKDRELPSSYTLTKAAPWQHSPGRWMDTILSLAARPETRKFARDLGGATKPEAVPPARRDALIARWLDGDPLVLTFAGYADHLGRYVMTCPRETARAHCARALQSDDGCTRAWALEAALSDLYDETDGDRDALALRLLEDPKSHALVWSRPGLAKWFTRPLRHGLVRGPVPAAACVCALVQSLAWARGGDTFAEDYWESLRKPLKKAARASRPPIFASDGPLNEAEWEAVRRVREGAWAHRQTTNDDGAGDYLSRSSWALSWLPTEPEDWTDDDHTFFAAVLARCDDEKFHEAYDTPQLAFAMLKVWRPAYLPYAARFVTQTEDFTRDQDVALLASLRAKLNPTSPAGAKPPTASHNLDDGWDDP